MKITPQARATEIDWPDAWLRAVVKYECALKWKRADRALRRYEMSLKETKPCNTNGDDT